MKQSIKNLFSTVGLRLSKLPPEGTPNCWPLQGSTPLTFFENDQLFHQLYEEAQSHTQMTASDNPLRRNRHYALHYLLRQAPIKLGEVAECGCWRGLSAYQIGTYLAAHEFNVHFHIFDSFEGLSEFNDEDRSKLVDSPERETSLRKEFAVTQSEVMSNLSKFSNFIEYYPGWIPSKFSSVETRKFSFVHIDVDMYEPIRDSVEFFWPRLVANGIILFDDYGFAGFPGAKKAVDEFLSNLKEEEFFFFPTSTGSAFLIKK